MRAGYSLPSMYYEILLVLQPLFVLDNCNFIQYGLHRRFKYASLLITESCVQHWQQYTSGTILFQQNMAENGGGIFSAELIFHFTENIGKGAVYLSISTTNLFWSEVNLSAEFENNKLCFPTFR